jgi:hypothetical protein
VLHFLVGRCLWESWPSEPLSVTDPNSHKSMHILPANTSNYLLWWLLSSPNTLALFDSSRNDLYFSKITRSISFIVSISRCSTSARWKLRSVIWQHGGFVSDIV